MLTLSQLEAVHLKLESSLSHSLDDCLWMSEAMQAKLMEQIKPTPRHSGSIKTGSLVNIFGIKVYIDNNLTDRIESGTIEIVDGIPVKVVRKIFRFA